MNQDEKHMKRKNFGKKKKEMKSVSNIYTWGASLISQDIILEGSQTED